MMFVSHGYRDITTLVITAERINSLHWRSFGYLISYNWQWNRPITIAIACNVFSLLIFEEKWPNYACRSKSLPNSDTFWLRRLFNVCVRVFCGPNVTILLVYIHAKIKMSFVWKDDFFLPKSASSVWRSQTHLAKRKRIGFVRRKNKTNYLWNQTWRKCYHSRSN